MNNNLLHKLLGSANVRYFPSLAKYVGGAKAALLLSQLLYWNAIYKEEWFYISVKDMQEQTGLTSHEQRTARKQLELIVEMKLKGIPRIWHYRVSLAALKSLIDADSQSMENPINVDGETETILSDKPEQLNRNHKTTKKTTHKNTKDSPHLRLYTEMREEWKRLFPDKSQPRKSTYLKQVKTRMRDEGFMEEWKTAMRHASRSFTCQTESWFDFGYFVRSEKTWNNCLNKWMEWKDKDLRKDPSEYPKQKISIKELKAQVAEAQAKSE